MTLRPVVLASVVAFAAGCAPAPDTAAAALPGVSAGDAEWFWRDVLSASLPGEAAALPLQGPPVRRIDALAALAPAGHPATLATLMGALRDEQPAVACAAAHDLGAFGLRAAIPRLLKGIGPYPIDYDVPLPVRAAQASALARLGNPAGMPLLLMILAEGTDLETPAPQLPWDRTERMVFAQELALEGVAALAGTDFGFDPSASVPDRQSAVGRAQAWWESGRLRLWAATAPLEDPGLVARVRILVAHLRAYQLRQVDGARYVLSQLGPGVLPFLQEGLASDDDYVRVHCLQVMERLADLADAKTRGRIAIVASDPLLHGTPTIAVPAAAAAGAAGVADPLIVALEARPERAVRLAVVDALGATGLAAAGAALRRWDSGDAALGPDLQAAREAALLATDAARDPAAFLALLAHEDAAVVYPALERLLQLVGSDCGIDPGAEPAARTAALERARAALLSRSR